ncbi:MAG: DUF2924 domain-containing protein [Myxococcota bacterium]
MKAQQKNTAILEVAQELDTVASMTVVQLMDKYREVFGEPTRSRNKAYLQKRISWRIQELAEGGLSARALAKIDALTMFAPARWRLKRSSNKETEEAFPPQEVRTLRNTKRRDPRLPPAGTVLKRVFKGTEYSVTVHMSDVEYEGQRYSSLSKVARLIAGTQWNGFAFFGLKKKAS